ncbi:MAG TPA: sugar phosphate nucleotidyltransferase [archaeon]|nr:sugar phosphate nucleotidyltransferase [archaeon]HLD81211.1 sugar phosphate nucleotidyltransferase [archaeon]
MERNVIGLIPAAGSGVRLYPFSKAVPKEMYPVLGKAVIEHAVENLKAGGIDKIYVIVGHKKGALMDYLGDGSFFDAKISYLYQLKPKGPGHAILQARDWVSSTFLTLFGDSFIEPKEEITRLIDFHFEEKPIATLLLFETPTSEGYGVAKLSLKGTGAVIGKVKEKPGKSEAAEFAHNGKYYAMCGAYVFDPRIFDFIARVKPGVNGEIQITDAVALALEEGEKVCGVVLKGKYIDMGKWKTILNVEKEMLKDLSLDSYISEREKMAEKINKQLKNSDE